MKKRYLFLIIVVWLFVISAVSGAEMSNDTNTEVNDYDSDLISESMNEDLLTDSYGTFKELQDEIDAVGYGGVLNLTRDYKYVNGSTEGVQINKAIIIDGQGHTLDGKQVSRIMKINGNQVILKNMQIINGKNKDYAGGIYFNADNGKILNCTFEKNSVTKDMSQGGGLCIYGKNNSVLNCKFIDNKAVSGGAISIYLHPNSIIENCTFINNYASFGGCIECLSYYGYKERIVEKNIFNCTFLNNNAKWDGGAIYFNNNVYDSIIDDCLFINNSAGNEGGSLYI